MEIITSILRNTRPLLGSDVPWISSHIVTLQNRLQSESVSAGKDSSADPTCEDPVSLQKHLEMHQSALAPIRKLPQDILLEIFWFCMPEPEDDSACEPNHARWTLSHVASFWRHVVLTSPSLWTTVVLQSPFTRHAEETLKQHLLHSGALRLRVALMCSPSDVFNEQIIQVISACSRRWRLLDVRLPKMQIEQIFSFIKPTELPVIEEITLECDATPQSLLGDNLRDALEALTAATSFNVNRSWFLHSPLLRRACLLVCPGSGISLHENLTHHSAIHFRSDGLETLLGRRNLVELNMIDLDPIQLSISPIIHPNIRKLRTSAVPLANLHLPHLVELTVDDEDIAPVLELTDTNEHTDYLISFLTRSQCQLENLHIYDISITTDPRLLTDILPSLAQTIVSVGLSFHPIDAQHTIVDMFTRFTRSSATAGLVPNMVSLDVSLPETETLALTPAGRDAVLGMVKSRRSRELAELWKAPVLQDFRFDTDNRGYLDELRALFLEDSETDGLRILGPTRSAWLLWQGPWLDRENWTG